ncbi:calcium-activated chloride channel-domain-containing protein [Phaeosphaeriaceae sp. PMI808]|nr:calcium-activated chloride channel-domain-containing protein [Phaeosphaeriaceae sp. PMI808]
MQLRRADTTLSDDTALANITYNDKYVVVYNFEDVVAETAISELTTLLKDLHSVGLNTEVRRGYPETLLVFVQAPREILGNAVYKSRVKDWLYGIIKNQPCGTTSSVVRADFEAEDVLSMHHLIHWSKELGGAGITPGTGQWTNVSSTFPLHNHRTNRVLLTHLSKRIFLTSGDLDQIRDLFGAKTAFYFAFIQTYFRSLMFPCALGVFSWAFLPKYSLLFASVIGIWCTVFLEYWKIKETDLALRWNVRGVSQLKLDRPQFQYEKTIIDAAGRVRHYFPRWKRVLRQLLVLPFLFVSLLFLGALIALVFVIETFISEAYEGPYKFYLEYLPTVLLAIFLPYATNILEVAATWMTEYENHRTADHHEMSLTQKIFVLNSITNYLPIFLTAFVYLPLGDDVIPMLQRLIDTALGNKDKIREPFIPDPDRLRNEVITLTLTGQVSGALEELALPWFKMKVKEWWRDRQVSQEEQYRDPNHRLTPDDPSEVRFLRRVRNQALCPGYNVQDDIAEMVIQFGYLALFSPVWPLVPIGFLINNWFEIRSDFIKICFEYQRPTPARSDGIGPWVASMESLTWLGSINSAAIVHLYGGSSLLRDRLGLSLWASLPLTIIISEHIFMGFRAGIPFALSRIGSEQTRKERDERYAKRKKHLEELQEHARAKSSLDVAEKERRKSIRINAADLFWITQADEGASEQVGINIIQAIKHTQDDKKVTAKGKFD